MSLFLKEETLTELDVHHTGNQPFGQVLGHVNISGTRDFGTAGPQRQQAAAAAQFGAPRQVRVLQAAGR